MIKTRMAPKKKHVVSKKSKSKASASKIANKHLNKLAKQGKLRKEASKQKRREKLALKAKSQASGNDTSIKKVTTLVEEEDVHVGDEDISYYGTPGQSYSFASTVKDTVLSNQTSSSKSSKKRKKEDENYHVEEDYERLPRKLFSAEKNMKMVLPIKTKKGFVQQMVEEQEVQTDEEEYDQVAEDDVEAVEEAVEAEPLPVLSSVELYALRQQKLLERKQKMAFLSDAIIQNPNESVKKLRELVSMLHEKDPDVFVTVRKYAIVSLLEVFKDIIPGYHIRTQTEKEKQQKMKKDTIELYAHEEGLLRCYQEYLEFLEKNAKGTKKLTEDLVVPEKAQETLTELSVKCLCDLLVRHPHFNYRNNIITVIVPYMNYRIPQIADMTCESVRKVFKEDKAGSVTLELTKCIGRMVKAREFRVQPKVLETFLSLRIKEVSYTDPMATDEKEKEKKNHTDKLSRREKKRRKHMMFLEKDLEETKATEDRKKRLRLHTETIQSVFLTYFRILKKATNSVLLPSVLEGLAKFAHLISVDFFDDLFAVFGQLIISGELAYRESLHCVQTAFTILSGQGSVLNIDPMVFYRHLYKNLFHVHTGCTCGDIPIVLECLDIMVSKRKRQISQQRILAFMKRLSTLALQQAPEGCLGLLACVRSFMTTYSYTDILLDNEAQGSGVFLPELEDPEHCNAHNSTMWELSYLQRHIDPVVRRYAGHISKGAPLSGEGQLPADIRKQPIPLYEQFLNIEIFDHHIPEKAKHVKHKVKYNGLLQDDLKTQMQSALEGVMDVPKLDLT